MVSTDLKNTVFSRSLLDVFVKVVDFIFQLSQLVWKLIVLDYSGLMLHLAEDVTEPSQLPRVVLVGVLHQVVTVGTILKLTF